MRFTSTLLLASLVLAGCASMSEPKPIAVASLSPTQGNQANGTVSFVQKGNQVLVDARIDGLTPGEHGIHIHEKGDCSAPDGTSAGGHFNPSGHQHGGPSHTEHHAGDFGNLTADASGRASLQLALPAAEISLAEGTANSIVGRGMIIHADPDDYKTQPTGNAGKRLACGVIRLK
jgi:Cu-Zn family superoxide dismutase